jgi:hypothetical protein
MSARTNASAKQMLTYPPSSSLYRTAPLLPQHTHQEDLASGCGDCQETSCRSRRERDRGGLDTWGELERKFRGTDHHGDICEWEVESQSVATRLYHLYSKWTRVCNMVQTKPKTGRTSRGKFRTVAPNTKMGGGGLFQRSAPSSIVPRCIRIVPSCAGALGVTMCQACLVLPPTLPPVCCRLRNAFPISDQFSPSKHTTTNATSTPFRNATPRMHSYVFAIPRSNLKRPNSFTLVESRSGPCMWDKPYREPYEPLRVRTPALTHKCAD